MFSDSQIKDALKIAIRELEFEMGKAVKVGRTSSFNFGAVGTVEGQYRVALSADRGADQPPERDQ